MIVRFTEPALQDIEEILDYLAPISPSAADGIGRRIAELVELLALQPRAGRATDDPLVRRVNLAPYPHAIFYEISEVEVVIMAVRHGARDPITMPGSGRMTPKR